MESIISKWKIYIRRNADLFLSFFVCGLSMYLFCIYSVTRYPRMSTLLTGDVLGQYIPALRSFAREVWSGNGLSYSWDVFLGMNATEYYGTYVGGSFVNLVYLFFPWLSPEAFIRIAFTLKTAMAGAGFTYFCKKAWNTGNMVPVFISVFYAMCGFQVSSNIVNYIWMDALYMLPIITANIVVGLKEKRWFPLVLSYAYLFVCNFYMGYMVGIFSAIFFIGYVLVYMLPAKGRAQYSIRVGLCYGGRVILAVGMAAFTLLPTAFFLFTKNPADTTLPGADLVQQDPVLLLSRFFFGIEVSNFVKLPHLYVGIPVLFLVVLFFLSRRVTGKEKWLYGLLTALMLLSCMVLPLYMFWHGFDNPDSWYHRFSYVISFLFAAMACKGADLLWEKRKNLLLGIGIAESIMTAGILYYATFKNRYQPVRLVWYNVAIALGWLVFLWLLLSVKEKGKRIMGMAAVCFAMAEVIMNGCLEDRFFQDKMAVDIWMAENEQAESMLSRDSDFFRIHCENSRFKNQDTYIGSNGVSDFWSFENYDMKKTLGNLGMYVSPRVMNGQGLNPFTQMLLGVKYAVRLSGSSVPEESGVTIEQFPRCLGLGFLVQGEVEQFSFAGNDQLVKREYEPVVEHRSKNSGEVLVENVFENCNILAKLMTGQESNIFLRVPGEEIFIEENGVSLGQDGEDFFFRGELKEEETKWIDFRITDTGREVFAAFEGNNTIASSDLPWIFNYYNAHDMGDVGVRYTKKLDLLGENRVCTVAMAKGVTRDYKSFKEAQFYYANEDALDEMYTSLSQNSLTIHKLENGIVCGSIYVPDNNKLLFTSIPYDDGWSVKAEGNEVEIVPLLDGAFLGVKFPEEGTYELTFSYHAPGLRLGIRVSLCFWGIFLLGCFGSVYRRKRT